MSKKYPGGVLSRTAPTPSGAFQNSTASGMWNMEDVAKFRQQGNWPTAGNVQNYIEDVFSTTLYTGNGSTQTITNGIDLESKGGLVWIKDRDSGAKGHALFDTARGVNKKLQSQSTNGEFSSPNQLTAFNADGFALGSSGDPNGSGTTYASWTFREQPKFFDVVTWTSTTTTNTNLRVSHNLGSVPGCIIIKATSTTDSWYVYHRELGINQYLRLNATSAAVSNTPSWGTSNPTSTDFGFNENLFVASAPTTFVAYLFAHNAGGFGDTGNDNVISCGTFTVSSNVATVTLGYEPQWTMMKRTDSTDSWRINDVMRGSATEGGQNASLAPNTSDAETTGTAGTHPTATGFTVQGVADGTYIYIAIRRPMRVPTVGTSVFEPVILENANDVRGSLQQSDFGLFKDRATTSNWFASDRLRGFTSAYYSPTLYTNLTDAEATPTTGDTVNARNTAGQLNGRIYFGGAGSSTDWPLGYSFKRARGFFDIVCWTGDGSTGRLLSHNLGVAPEIILMKSRSATGDWRFWCRSNSFYAGTASTGVCLLPLIADAFNDGSNTYGEAAYFPAGLPTTSNFSVLNGNAATNATGVTQVAYLFASCPGVSRVGGYTGNGSSQTINCGFTTGARFVLIKRTDASGNWLLWDTARGITSGVDAHISLNTTGVDTITQDSIDPDNTGFVVNQLSATNINVNTAKYIFLAIA